MPQSTNEITSSSSLSRSLGDKGQVADSVTRVFRVILSQPGENVNYEQQTGISVGAPHPTRPGLICRSYEARYEGDSRMALLVTYQYEPLSAQDDRDKPPDIRPANWSISSATYEAPKTQWKLRLVEFDWEATWKPAVNCVGDIYDGITSLDPLVRITISQWEAIDPTRHCEFVGSVNSETIRLGSLTIKPHQLLFMGVNQTPAIETFNDISFRGWRADYEFHYKRNPQKITTIFEGIFDGKLERFPDVKVESVVDIGWDIAVPQTGFNVRAFDPANVAADEDVFGQPLRHGDRASQHALRIPPPPYELPEGVAAGDKVRAMVKVFSYQNGGTSQSASAQPIALKDNGRPLKVDPNANPAVLPIVYAYQVHDAINITRQLGLRLF